jgi:type I restriction enzyme S subunit
LNEVIDQIPKFWTTEKIGKITRDITSGFASGERDDEGIVQLRMNNIDVSGNINTDKLLKVPIPKNIKKYLLENGDILFNNTNSVDLIGKSAIYREEVVPCTYSNHLTRIRAKEEVVEQEWILYNLMSLWKKGIFYRICNRHVGQAGITLNDIENLRINIPPLVEQRGIAEILSTIDEAIKWTDAAISKAEELKRGLMQRLLARGIEHTKYKQTELGIIPESWDIVAGINIYTIVGGYAPNQIHFSERDIADGLFLKVNDLNNEENIKYITTSENKFILSENPSIKLHPINTIVIAKRGAAILQNRIRILAKPAALDPNLMGLICKKTISPEYLAYILENKKIFLLIENAGIPQLNNKQLYPLKFAIPSIEEQRKIIDAINCPYLYIKSERENKKRLELLKKGMMSSLLSGKIRVELRGDRLYKIEKSDMS